MQLIVIGAHQRTAPVAIRERLAFAPAALPAALADLRAYAAEGFIVSTCNRVEIYGLTGANDQGRTLRHFLASCHQLDPEEIAPHLYTFSGADAVRHLFRVSAGLDSMALGEDQIMSQIKTAAAEARAAAMLGTITHRLIDTALAAGKQVRTQTGLARSQLSVVSVALHLARQTAGSLSGRRVLVVGAGRTAELALKHLKTEDLAALNLTSRSPGRAQNLAARYGATCWPADQLGAAIAASDLVLSCTSATDIVIDAALVEAALAGRDQPLLLLDLAVPRDIDRHAGALPGVHLFDVDDMQAVCDANRAARAAEVDGAEAIVEHELHKWMAWWSAQEVLPTILALRAHAEAIRAAELQRTLARLPGLSEREQAAVEALTLSIINKLLHHPITTLKTPAAGGELAQAAQQLFQLQAMRNTNGTTES